jgi:hypothetical protein
MTNDKIKLKDGRFAVPPSSLLLVRIFVNRLCMHTKKTHTSIKFASRNPARMPGLKVRYIEVRERKEREMRCSVCVVFG